MKIRNISSNDNNIDKKEDNNLKENLNNNKKPHKKLKIVIIIVSIIAIVIFAIIAIYNYINYSLDKQLKNDNSNNMVINYNFNYILLWDKSLEYIKQSDKEFEIVSNDIGVVYQKENINKYNVLSKINISEEELNYDKISGIKGVKIEILKGQENIKSIHLNSNKINFENTYVDIYYLDDNNNINLYKKAIEVKDGLLFDVLRNENGNVEKSYIITYVPVTDIKIESDTIEVNKNQTKNINISILPDNATNTNLFFEYNNDGLAISSEGVLTPSKSGEYKVRVSVKNENISKEINVKVNEIAENIEVNKNSVSLYVAGKTKIEAKVMPEGAINNELEYISSDSNIAVVDESGNITAKNVGKCNIEIKTRKEPIVKTNVNVEVKAVPVNNNVTSSANNNSNNSQTSNGFTYVNGILVVNKKYSLPSTYNPGVNQTALNAYYSLKDGAQKAGYAMPLLSGFRSYSTQVGLYNRYVSMYGQAAADTFSARPGHSEHQTGLSFDVGSIDDNYGSTPAGKWLENNCYKYGFIIRYPKNKQNITGYQYEPWHIRYLGNPTATNVYNSGLCLEEYLGI